MKKAKVYSKERKKLGGGIYLIGYPDRARNFEILIDKSQKFSVFADTTKINAIRFWTYIPGKL